MKPDTLFLVHSGNFRYLWLFIRSVKNFLIAGAHEHPTERMRHHPPQSAGTMMDETRKGSRQWGRPGHLLVREQWPHFPAALRVSVRHVHVCIWTKSFLSTSFREKYEHTFPVINASVYRSIFTVCVCRSESDDHGRLRSHRGVHYGEWQGLL